MARKPYLIDHGATLTFAHDWTAAARFPARPYDAADHVLLGSKPDVAAADAVLAPRVTPDLLADVVALVPDEWLDGEPGFGAADEVREVYRTALRGRVEQRDTWLPGVVAAAGEGRPRPVARESRRPSWLRMGGAGR